MLSTSVSQYTGIRVVRYINKYYPNFYQGNSVPDIVKTIKWVDFDNLSKVMQIPKLTILERFHPLSKSFIDLGVSNVFFICNVTRDGIFDPVLKKVTERIENVHFVPAEWALKSYQAIYNSIVRFDIKRSAKKPNNDKFIWNVTYFSHYGFTIVKALDNKGKYISYKK